MHTVYGGANLLSRIPVSKMGEIALKSLKTFAPDFVVLAKVLEMEGHAASFRKKIAKLVKELDRMSEKKRKTSAWLPYSVYQKIIRKLKTEAVEDFRIDFEDGFGNRPDAEEDATAVQAALELAKGMKQQTISPFIGIRIKPFTEDLKTGGPDTRSLSLHLAGKTGGRLPDNFVVMLPKVTIPEQVTTLVRLFELIERQFAPDTRYPENGNHGGSDPDHHG